MSNFNVPKWFSQFVDAYRNGSTQGVILHLAVGDYAVPGVRIPAWLAMKFASRNVVAFYNRSQGITFPVASMRQKFMELTGLSQPVDPALAALGMASGASGGELPKAPAAALPLLEKLLQSNCKAVVIVNYTDTLTPATDIATMSADDRTALVTLARWGTDRAIEAAGNIVFLLTENIAALHQMLRAASSGYLAIEVPLPTRETRQEFITWYLDEKPVDMEMDANLLAFATAGLSLVHIENLFLAVNTAGQLTWQIVRDLKKSIIETEYAGLLDVLDPSANGFKAVGGMQALKDWAEAEIIAPVKADELSELPQGVLMVGPPGCGKTFFVTALAGAVGFNAVQLRMDKILGGIVGTSERNLARVLAVVRSLSPTILFADEFDQTDIGNRGQGSGNPVAKNLFGMILSFLSDPSIRGKVIFIAATNRPDYLDPAVIRSGRVEAILPVLLPELDDRIAAASVTATALKMDIDPQAVKLIGAGTEGYSRADVAQVVRKARKLARRAQHATIGKADMQTALDCIKPPTLAQNERYTLLAVEACNDAEMLPEKYRKLLADRSKLKETIDATATPRGRGQREL